MYRDRVSAHLWAANGKMRILIFVSVMFVAISNLSQAQADIGSSEAAGIPADIKAIMRKPMYKNAIWGLRVITLDSRHVLLNFRPNYDFLIGSVRKVFSIGELLNQIGPAYRYNTPVFRHGKLDHVGVLHGDLILVASGDLTMGGRTRPDGTIAVTNFDHNDADDLGNAVLSKPDPLSGYVALAKQVARQGITKITGEVIIDDRLFQPFYFRNQFDLRAIFVNDDVVDLTINPTAPGGLASVVWRPVSAALGVKNKLTTSGHGSAYTLGNV
jgi:D-alanyl-D-alanine carboxypeptidase